MAVTGEPRRNGYWLLEVLGADVERENLIRLYGELYSQQARDFRSENSQILGAIERVMEGVGQLRLRIPLGQFMKPIQVESVPSSGKVPNFL
jgi:hypothetical protein